MVNVPARPRFFLGNFDFEHRIADPKWEPNEKLKRLNAEMATAWLSIAEDGDLIWTPSPVDEDFLASAKRQGLPVIVPIGSLDDVPRDVECIPWGWSAEIRQFSEQFGWRTNAPTPQAVRLANSRRTSFDLEQRWNVGLQGARSILSLDEFTMAVQSIGRASDHWVVKAEFGMSARERILGCGIPSQAETNWVSRRLKQQGIVFFEPWVDRMSEVGIQFEVPLAGTPTLVGLTPIHVDRRGQYAGSWFAYCHERFAAEESLWKRAIEVALQAACHVQTLGYFGPLGIDSMIYRNELGSPQVRPLQDINARWTMGRLSLGWKRLVGPREEGVWRHGAEDAWLSTMQRKPDRLIRTSPRIVGSSRCIHETSLLIWNKE